MGPARELAKFCNRSRNDTYTKFGAVLVLQDSLESLQVRCVLLLLVKSLKVLCVVLADDFVSEIRGDDPDGLFAIHWSVVSSVFVLTWLMLELSMNCSTWQFTTLGQQ